MEQRCTRAIIHVQMMFLDHLTGSVLTGKGNNHGKGSKD
jgi:hypothetical protein